MSQSPTNVSDVAFPGAETWLVGGGEMGERIRTFDWSDTPVGPIESWPLSLKTSVRIILNSRYPMFVWWGRERTNLYNDAYIPVLGKRHPAALGLSAARIWSEIWPVVGPLSDAVLIEGRATWNEESLLILERNQFLEETYFTFSYSPIIDEEGGVGGMFCACTEDTQRVLGRRRLRTLRGLAERAADGKTAEEACELAAATMAENCHDLPFTLLYLLDGDGHTARLVGRTGIENGTPASPPVVELKSPDAPWPFSRSAEFGASVEAHDLPGTFGPLPGGAWPESPQRAVVLPMAKPGQTQLAGFVVAGISPRLVFTDEYKAFMDLLAGHVVAAVANARAYEEEKRRAEALAELDRAKTAFFSNVSHEFRTPLTLMLGPVEDLLGSSSTDLSPTVKGQLEVVNRNGLRLLRLVNSLLDFSRIEAGRVQASFAPTTLAELTADLASVFRSATERAGLQLVVDCPPLSEPVYVDREMWEKIVLNLLSNAFKFTFQGSITVSLRQVGRTAELRVHDTGVGIPAEEIPRLFERFHRIENRRSRTHEGSGIGLALVQELIKLHGGSIRVESRSDEGSTFIVTVPLGATHLPPDRIEAQRPLASTGTGATPFVEEALRWLPAPAIVNRQSSVVEAPPETNNALRMTHDDAAGPRPHVLLADDNSDMRQYVSRLLRGRFDVQAVADGQAALDAARANPPDVVLTDVMMPRLDGFGLLRELREDPHLREIPVILLSARAGEESRVEGVEAGADDYLIKPFSARELIARVETHVNLSRMRRNTIAALRESQERLALVQHVGGVGSFEWNPQTGVNTWSPELEAMYGLKPGEFGRTQAAFEARVHPDDRARVRADIDEALRHGTPTEREWRIVWPDGSVHWVAGRFQCFMDAEGKPTLATGINIDITDRKRAEEARAHLAAIVEWSEDAIIGKDLGGIITSWNKGAEKIFGYASEEAIGKPIAMLIPQHRIDEEAQILRNISRGETVEPYETVRQRKDGSLIDISLSVSPIVDSKGHIVGASKIARDITERKRAEDELRRWKDQLELRVKERTTALTLSHERLRAMAAELTLTEQRERRRLATELHDYLAQLLVVCRLKLGQGQRLGQSEHGSGFLKDIDHLLDQSLTYTRSLVAELSPQVLYQFGLPKALHWLGTQMRQHGLIVSVHTETDSVPLSEEQAVLLYQSVRELLLNVVKHAATDRATITLSIQPDHELRIVVADQGRGFDLSGSPDPVRSSHFGHVSIRERMEALKGRLEIRSSPGMGTVVALAMTLAPSGTADSSAGRDREHTISRRSDSRTEQQGRQNIATRRILLADDHPLVREGLRSSLAGHPGFEIIGEATSGAEAVELAQALRPDVVVMDVNMPDMDGIEAARRIMAHAPTMRIIGLSVSADEFTRTAMLKAGASLFLSKQADADQLCRVIASLPSEVAREGDVRPGDGL